MIKIKYRFEISYYNDKFIEKKNIICIQNTKITLLFY